VRIKFKLKSERTKTRRETRLKDHRRRNDVKSRSEKSRSARQQGDPQIEEQKPKREGAIEEGLGNKTTGGL
jgi:hypothetical protein